MLKITREERNLMGMIVLFAFVAMMVVALIAFILQNSNLANNKPVVTEASRPKLTAPSGWTYYTNDMYGFGIAHPTGYSPQESIVAIGRVEAGVQRDSLEVNFRNDHGMSDEPENAPLQVRATKQTFDQAIKGRESLAANNNPQAAVVSQITHQEELTVAGHRAVRFDQKDSDQTPGENRQKVVYTTYIYIAGPKYVYILETTSLQQNAIDDSIAQTMLSTFIVTAS